MAVFQAADAFELFTGVEPDRERMLRHFADARASRRRDRLSALRGRSPPSASAARSRRSSPPPPRAGFDGVEIFEPDLIASPLAPAEVRRARCATSA